MKNINEFLLGKDYSDKTDLFNKKLEDLHEKWDGDFDISNAYFTMQPHQLKDEIRLVFDHKKDIPKEIKDQVLKIFKEVWR